MRILSACLMPALGTASAAMFIAGCGPTSGSPQGAPPPNSPPAAPTASASLPIATSSTAAVSVVPAVPAVPATGRSSAPTGGTAASGAAGLPASPSTSCATYAATHTFAEVTAAKLNADGSLAIAAHAAKVVCGGTDDLHYSVATATEFGTVTPSGAVRMLTGAVKEQTVPHADVGSRLAQDKWGRIFMVNGPLRAVTALTEEYHP